MTLSEAINLFQENKLYRGCVAGTLANYRSQLDLLTRWLACREVEALEQVTTLHLEQYIAETRTRGHFQPGRSGRLSPVTLRKRAKMLKTFFSWCLSRQLVARDVSLDLHIPNTGRRIPKAPTPDQMAALLKYPMSVRDRAILFLMIDTGLRLAEVSGLDLGDVDLPNGIAMVRHGKGDKERLTLFERETAAALTDYLRARVARPDEPGLFIGERGERMTRGALYKAVKRIARKAKLEHAISPHRLRHGFVSTYLDAGGKVEDAQALAGHEHVQTTIGYNKISLQRLRREHARLSPVRTVLTHDLIPEPVKEGDPAPRIAALPFTIKELREGVSVPVRFRHSERARRWFAEGFDDAEQGQPALNLKELARLQGVHAAEAYGEGRRYADLHLILIEKEPPPLPPEIRVSWRYGNSARGRHWFARGFDDELKQQPGIDLHALSTLRGERSADSYRAGREAARRYSQKECANE